MKTKLVLALIIFSLLVISTQTATYAMDTMDMSPSVIPTVSPIITMENQEVQYDLPYPGLLPDSPLYFLKVMRDKMVEFFISSPSKKADYELLQADKRMNTGIYLSNEKPVKEDLISSSISKSINYFEQAIVQAKLAQQQGDDMQSFVQHMDTASQKYHSVLLQLETKSSSTLKNDLKDDDKRLSPLRANVVKMEKK